MNRPPITALIDTYNQSRFIEQAIESVLAQNFSAQELEILVVDDGSTDDTAARVARFGERVRYIRKANGGQASALNLGFAESRGEIIALLDGDDLWLPGKLRRVLGEFERNPRTAMVYHAMEYHDLRQDRAHPDDSFAPMCGWVPASAQHLLRYGQVSTSNMALRRAVLERLLPIPDQLRLYADSYLGYTVIFAGEIAGLREPLTRYRIHGGNLATRADASIERLRNRHECFRLAVQAIHAWLARNGFDPQGAEAGIWLRRQALVEQMLRFSVAAPRRAELFRYLWEQQELYAPIWSSRYRSFRKLAAVMAFVIGYRGFHAMQRAFRRTAQTVAPGRTIFSVLEGARERIPLRTKPIST